MIPELKRTEIRDRYRGAMLGLAICDALGTTLEFKRPGSFTPISDMVGGGPAVNLGDDADTTGAVYGQIAGAFYGASGIPEDWLSKLHGRNMIQGLADHLSEFTGN